VCGGPIRTWRRYRYRRFSPTWESIPVWVHVFWLLASFVHDVDVIFLPTYKPTKTERANPQIYAANVQRVLGSLRTRTARTALLTHTHARTWWIT
jgi:hypothetical protein